MDMLSQFSRRSMRETEPTSFLCEAISYLISSELLKKAHLLLTSHRAATTNSAAFVSLLLHPPPELGLPKTRLNLADHVGELHYCGDLSNRN